MNATTWRDRLNRKFLMITAIMLIAGFLRLWQITEVPPGLWPDEAANGVNVIEALKTGSFKIFYPENNGREGMFINIQALAVKIFGPEPWALRMVSAVFGTLTVLGLYLVVKELFHEKFQAPSTKSQTNPNDQNPKHQTRQVWDLKNWKLFGNWKLGFGNCEVALLSSFFLATSFWHINFSRIGFRAIAVPFFAVFGIYWLMKALRTGKISSAVLGGIATGLGFHTYIAFRFMPFVIAVPIVYSLVDWFSQPSQRPKASVSIGRPIDTDGNRDQPAPSCLPCIIALYLFITFVVALPIGLYFLQHPEDFASRSGPISILAAESPLKEFIKSIVITLGMFNVVGDCNPRHNFFCRSELYWPVGILFVIGLVQTIRHLGKKESAEALIPRRSAYTLLAWFIFMMLPSALTREGLPHALRAIGTIPAVFVFSGIGGWVVWRWIGREIISRLEEFIKKNRTREMQPRLKRIKREFWILAALFFVWVASAEGLNYFFRWAPSPRVAAAFEESKTELANYILTIPEETPVWVVVNEPSLLINGISLNAQPVVFLVSRRPNTFFVTPETLDNIPAYLDRAVFVGLHTDRDLLSQLKTRYLSGGVNPVTGDILPFVIPK